MNTKLKLILFFGLFFLNVATWIIASRSEHKTIQKLTNSLNISVQKALNDNLRENSLALQRMARRWRADNGTEEARWRADAKSYSNDLLGVVGTGFADQKSKINWIEPEPNNIDAIGFRLNSESIRKKAIDLSLVQQRPIISGKVNLVQGGIGFLIICPVYVYETVNGFVFLISRYTDYFSKVISFKEYSISIKQDGHEIFRNDQDASFIENEKFKSVTTLKVGEGVYWDLDLRPSRKIVESIEGSTINFFMGISLVFSVFSFLLLNMFLKLKTSSKKIIAQEAWFRLIANSLPQLMWTCLPEGPCDYLSSQWVSYTGIPENEQLDFAWLNQIHPDDKERVIGEWQKNVVLEKTFDIKFRIRNKDGQYRWFHTLAIPIKDSTGNIIKWLGSNTDVHDLILAKEVADSAVKAKNLFLASMSHEIRTPLNGVLGMATLLRNTALTDEQLDYVKNIDESGTLLSSLINDILDLSKIEAGQLVFENVDFSLDQLIDNIISSFQFSAKKKNIALFSLHQSEGFTWVKGDVQRIKQVLINLVGNAIKFTIEGRVIIKSKILKKTHSQIEFEISVEDYGIGMTEEVKNKIFNSFSQGDSSINRRFGGTGLGLAISKLIVNQMNGDIIVKTEYGVGSEFTVHLTLPIGKENLILPSDQSLNEKFVGKVLIAEDNAVNQKVAQVMLKKMGVDSLIANNGNEAIAMLEKFNFDLILMDCQMPDMDGFEATKIIRSLKNKNQKIPIVAMTANAMAGDKERCLEVGMNDYISKPVSVLHLRGVLRKWLSGSD